MMMTRRKKRRPSPRRGQPAPGSLAQSQPPFLQEPIRTTWSPQARPPGLPPLPRPWRRTDMFSGRLISGRAVLPGFSACPAGASFAARFASPKRFIGETEQISYGVWCAGPWDLSPLRVTGCPLFLGRVLYFIPLSWVNVQMLHISEQTAVPPLRGLLP